MGPLFLAGLVFYNRGGAIVNGLMAETIPRFRLQTHLLLHMDLGRKDESDKEHGAGRRKTKCFQLKKKKSLISYTSSEEVLWRRLLESPGPQLKGFV